MQARQKAQISLGQQRDRLTEAYLGEIILLEEYRWHTDTEQRHQTLEEQQLLQQVNRCKELSRRSNLVEAFCKRVQQGLAQASFEQKRQLVELLMDRVVASETEVEIFYMMPTSQAGEKTPFSYLRTLY